MRRSTEGSAKLFRRAIETMVEGGSSPSRGPANYGDYPLFIDRGAGAHIWDVDGNEYIDWMLAYGALPLGHAHPVVTEAVREAAATGNLFAAATEVEVEVAERIASMIPGAEKVRFANTGTEATMAAIRLARGVTGRPKFIKFEGHYHGWYDDFLASSHPVDPVVLGHRRNPVKIPDSSGLNRRALEDTIVVPWNDLEAMERAVIDNRAQLAAVITEGVMANIGVIPPRDGFLTALREITRANDVLLILDETVTGFRVAPGGCQQHYAVGADIVTFGKGVGAGLPVAGFCGRADLMDALAWGGVLHYGTQNASRVGMFAAAANLRELDKDDGAAFAHVWMIGDSLCNGLRELFAARRIPAIVQNVGPMLQIMFTERDAIHDLREFCAHVDRKRFQRFVWQLFQQGVYMSPSAALHSVACVAHTPDDVAATLAAVERVLEAGG
ncbi:MAG: aspartate aminotransferase family protein [Acidobacteriota bacterium]|jgi:glutamate-1-semialdehyde 2,1-aminomutase